VREFLQRPHKKAQWIGAMVKKKQQDKSKNGGLSSTLENNMTATDLLKMIDDGVPLQVALAACGVSEDGLSDKVKATLKERQAVVRARIMQRLYQATQRASATPTAVASAAKTWLELSKEEKTDRPISIEIVEDIE
jgi:hypothetical protein